MPVSRMGLDREPARPHCDCLRVFYGPKIVGSRVGKLCCEFKTTGHGLSACSFVTGLKDIVRVPYRLRKVHVRAP